MSVATDGAGALDAAVRAAGGEVATHGATFVTVRYASSVSVHAITHAMRAAGYDLVDDHAQVKTLDFVRAVTSGQRVFQGRSRLRLAVFLTALFAGLTLLVLELTDGIVSKLLGR